MATAADYRFRRFTVRHLLGDMRFSRGSLGPGNQIPDVDLYPLDSDETITTRDLLAGRPTLLVTGSITCPMTSSSTPVLKRLYEEFGDRVNFVMLNVREAHPGESMPQPETIEEKKARASILGEHFGIPWMVVADDIEGTLHRALDSKPNSAVLVDADGVILFRAHWASDIGALRRALGAVVTGKSPTKKKSGAMMLPVARAMGHVRPALDIAGAGAERDLLLAASPMALAGRLASMFRPLSLDQRGLVTSLIMVAFITFELAFLAFTVRAVVS